MKIDLYSKYKIKYAAALPLSRCDVVRPYLLDRAGLPSDGDGSVMLFLLPYYTTEGEGGNLSMYAVGRDYHAVFSELAAAIIGELRAAAPEARFAAYADHSPINEKPAAAMANLGVIGRHSLLINREYSSFVFIGGIYSDIDAERWLSLVDGVTLSKRYKISSCDGCGACVCACPSGCLVGDGLFDAELCFSAISQKKSLTDGEKRAFAASSYVWGCDVCQLACPVTKAAIENKTIYTPIKAFKENIMPNLDEQILNELSDSGELQHRAYAWRGEDTIRRNLLLKTRSVIDGLTEPIIAAVIKAGSAIVTAHDVESGILVKPGDDNFATEWDLLTQKRLVASLASIAPDAVFLAEEEPDASLSALYAFTATVPDKGTCFVIDPIDGTTNFIHGMKLSAVSVALIHDGVTAFGCVYNPYLDECFHATVGGGAFIRRRGSDTPISVSERALSDALVGFGTTPYDKAHADDTFSRVCDFFRICRDVRRGGSAALDVCYVAAGRFDVFFEMSLSPWDFAAAALILREAGGILTDIDGQELQSVTKSSVLATNVAARAEAEEILRRHK